MLYYNRVDISEGNDLAKPNNNKNVWFVTIYFSVMVDSNFKILYAMVVMIRQY